LEVDNISIRIDLKDELAKKFNAVKRARCFENNTELIRQLILEEAKRLTREVPA